MDFKAHPTVNGVPVALAGASSLPPGVVVPYAGAMAGIPAGWLYCDGAAVRRESYAALFAAIGEFYGAGDGATTFNLPDLRSRFPMGADPQPFGATGGEASHTLDISELPAHTHPGSPHDHVMDHDHTVSDHTHPIGSHTHSITHTHTVNSHTHTLSSHTHALSSHTHTVSSHNHGPIQYGLGGPKFITLNGGGSNYNLTWGVSGAPAGELWPQSQSPVTGGPSNNTSGGPSNNTSGAAAPGVSAPNVNVSGASEGQVGNSGVLSTYPTTGMVTNSATAASLAAGGGQAHNNLPPYQALAFIIKT